MGSARDHRRGKGRKKKVKGGEREYNKKRDGRGEGKGKEEGKEMKMKT